MPCDEVAEDFGRELASDLGLDLPLSRAIKEQYDRMITEGLGDLDNSGIAEAHIERPPQTFRQSHIADAES